MTFQPATPVANSQVGGQSTNRITAERILSTPEKDKARDRPIFNEKKTLANPNFNNISPDFLLDSNGPFEERKSKPKGSNQVIRTASASFGSAEKPQRKSFRRLNSSEK